MEAPVPIEVPAAHPPSYHTQSALVPRLPPVTDKVTELPRHTFADEAVAPVGSVEGVQFDPTVALQVVVQPFASDTV